MYYISSLFFHLKYFFFFLSKSIDNKFICGRYFIIKVKGKLSIARNVAFRNFCNIFVLNEGELFIQENCFFNNCCSLNCMGKIKIGKNSVFGEGVKIYDHNHIYNTNKIIKKEGYKIKPVVIGDNVWVGSNVVILPGVTIGNNSVIGAGCVVYKDIPNETLMLSNGVMKKIERV